MFAGVAASSMPTVNQFLTRQNLTLMSWTSSLKSSITHLLSSSKLVKLSDNDSNITAWGRGNTHNSETHGAFTMKDLKSNDDVRKAAKISRMEDSQIRLTHDISVTEHSLDEASFKPVLPGRYP